MVEASEEFPSPKVKGVKLLCFYEGAIAPTSSDGTLHYTGGQRRIIAVNRSIAYSELMSKMLEVYPQTAVIKYQLPGEDLDTLVSIWSDEDIENMFDEHDNREVGARIKVFLFSSKEHEAVIMESAFMKRTDSAGRDGMQNLEDLVRFASGEECSHSSSENTTPSPPAPLSSPNELSLPVPNAQRNDIRLPSQATGDDAKQHPEGTKKVIFEDPTCTSTHVKTEDDRNSVVSLTAPEWELEAMARGLQIIRNADLEERRELGAGTFGTVYYGKWRGCDVAIKRLNSTCFSGSPAERERQKADFWKEACILAQLHHPNVVAFYGVVLDGPDGTLAMVTEFMINGSIKQVLRKKVDRVIDPRRRLLVAMDAASGMEYLHSKKIVHFDLKCENLFVNIRDPQRPICKVGDFGLSKMKQRTFVSGGMRGTLPWMAPELLNGSSNMVSEKVDVYSFGIVMWELLTGEEPYSDLHYGAILQGILDENLRPPVREGCDPAWKLLMERCWSADPASRPTFSEITDALHSMASSQLVKEHRANQPA